MFLTLTISQGGKLIKAKPDLPTLRKKYGAAYLIGGLGPYQNFLPQPAPPPEGCEAVYMVYSPTGNRLGRGFTLRVDKGFAAFRIQSPLPTTIHDLEDMVTFAGILAGIVGVEKVDCEGVGPVRASALAMVFPQIRQANCELLKTCAIDRPGFMVSGVRFPLQIPPTLCQRIAGLPAENGALYFADYLAEKQWKPGSYLFPQLQPGAEDGQRTAVYTLQEDAATLIPKEPFIPLQATPATEAAPTHWNIILTSNHLGVLGTLPYATFFARLLPRELTEFDALHFMLRPLSLSRIKEILSGDTPPAEPAEPAEPTDEPNPESPGSPPA